MLKKAQTIGTVVIIIIVLIVGGLTLVFGYRWISGIQDKGCDAIIVLLKKDLGFSNHP